MDIEEYFRRFPDAERYRNYLGRNGRPQWVKVKPKERKVKGEMINISTRIYECILLFDEDTAPCLGGPFPGDAAGVWIDDFRLNILRPLPSDKEVRRIFGSNFFPYKYKGESDEEAIERGLRETRTKERPFRTYIFGNDDTSYSKMYATEEEAREEIELLEAIEPVNLRKDIIPLGFFFSN